MSHRHFSKEERLELRGMLKTGLTQATIARALGRSPGSLSREIKKGGGRKSYCVSKSTQLTAASHCMANQRFRKLGRDAVLTDRTVSLLELGWSPEQIVGRTNLEEGLGLVKEGSPLTSAQTIYNFVNPRPELAKLLPRQHSKYRRTRSNSLRQQKRADLETKRSIETRPPEIETRVACGHWEGDTIIGTERNERILTHVERMSGYLLASKTKNGEAEEIRKQTERDFKPIPNTKKETCTYDRGVEFAEWELTEAHTKTIIYFAHAYHSWERGTNENTNGLIRRDYPKGTPFATITSKQLTQTVYRINHRPRKRLGYKTPHEVFNGVAIRSLI